VTTTKIKRERVARKMSLPSPDALLNGLLDEAFPSLLNGLQYKVNEKDTKNVSF
jgi:hypothetical protein